MRSGETENGGRLLAAWSTDRAWVACWIRARRSPGDVTFPIDFLEAEHRRTTRTVPAKGTLFATIERWLHSTDGRPYLVVWSDVPGGGAVRFPSGWRHKIQLAGVRCRLDLAAPMVTLSAAGLPRLGTLPPPESQIGRAVRVVWRGHGSREVAGEMTRAMVLVATFGYSGEAQPWVQDVFGCNDYVAFPLRVGGFGLLIYSAISL